MVVCFIPVFTFLWIPNEFCAPWEGVKPRWDGKEGDDASLAEEFDGLTA